METTIKQIKRLFLLLFLIVAGAQSAWAKEFSEFHRFTHTMYGVNFELVYYEWRENDHSTLRDYGRYASIIDIPSGANAITIPEKLVYNAYTYDITSVGEHYAEPSISDYSLSGANNYSYLKSDLKIVPVSVSGSTVQSIVFQGAIKFVGDFVSQSLTTLEFQKDVTINSNVTVAGLRTLNLGGALTLKGTLLSQFLEEIHFNELTCSGKFNCSSLKNVYFTNTDKVSFTGNWSDHFSAPAKSVTAHVYDLTPNAIAALKNKAVWCDFKEIVNHKSDVSYTLVTNDNIEMKFYKLNGNASFVSATSLSQIASITSGSKTGTVKSEGNYAVVLPSSNLANKNVQLTRNGQAVTLEPGNEQGSPVMFYEELNLQEDVRYEVTVTDKTCNFTLTQTGYKGNITYTKTLNGTTSSGLIYTSEGSFICAQGSTVKLSIPYDQYTPKTLEVNGSQKTLTYENGRATASFGVPSASSIAATLTWEPPAALPENHELPQVMVMRMGQGDVVLKDVFYTEDPQEMDYWRLDDPGWALRRTVNCEDAITTVAISDLDGSGNPRDDADWGFIVEATPLAGQIVKAVLLGHVLRSEHTMEWEDAFTEENLMPHLSIDATTGKHTLHMGGDEMWYGPGNYTVLVEMGPAESEVKTHASLNFVRKGGRSRVRLYREDCETDGWFDIDEGTTIHELKLYAPAEAEECGQSMNITQQLFVSPVEGEVIHIYCDGRDVTTQAWNDENEDYQLTLERADHTYTVLIDDAPDANPTWTIRQEEGMNTIVMYTKGDTYTETTYTGTLNKVPIDDTEIDKVTLKVYAENQNDSKPLRILRNGEDVSYMFNNMINDGQDGFRLCYEVPVNVLTNCDWDISYNIDHQQTFIVNGGTTEQVVEMEYEHLKGGPYLHANNDGIPATGYIPPFDNAKNSYVYLTFYVKEDETAKILRNGIDVTDLFERGKTYYDLQINDADYDGNNTLSALGFDIREAATWQIDIKITKIFLEAYVGGGTLVKQRIMPNGDIESEGGGQNYSGHWIKDGEGVRILFIPDANGAKLKSLVLGTTALDLENESRLELQSDGIYVFTLTAEQVAELRTANENIQVFAEFEKPNTIDFSFVGDFYLVSYKSDYEMELDDSPRSGESFEMSNITGSNFQQITEGTDLDGYLAQLHFKPKDSNATIRVYRNGEELTESIQTTYQQAGVLNYYYLEGSDSSWHSPASWVIIADDGSGSFDLNHDGKVDIADVTKLVNEILEKNPNGN